MHNLQLAYEVAEWRIAFVTSGAGNPAWLASPALPYAVFVDEARVDDWRVVNAETGAWHGGIRDITIECAAMLPDLSIVHHTRAYENMALIEMWQDVRNIGADPVNITRIDSLALNLAQGQHELLYFTSDWGAEFEPVRSNLTNETLLETKAGRSSKGMHPWFALIRDDGGVLSASVAWSGNWRFRFAPSAQRISLSGGLSDWEFAKTLRAGEAMESPKVVLALGHGGDLNTVSKQYARVGRKYWYPRNAIDVAAAGRVESLVELRRCRDQRGHLPQERRNRRRDGHRSVHAGRRLVRPERPRHPLVRVPRRLAPGQHAPFPRRHPPPGRCDPREGA